MDSIKKFINRQTTSGRQITVNDVNVTPQFQTFSINWPYGGFIWKRPSAVLVERQGQVERLPVVDVTRIALISLLGLSAVLFLLNIIFLRDRRDQDEQEI